MNTNLQVKNIDSLKHYTDKFGMIDAPVEYLGYETNATFLAEYQDATVHPLPCLITNNGEMITQHVWPLTWKQKNKTKNHGVFDHWAPYMDLKINPVNQQFNTEQKYVWLPIDASSCNNPWHIWIDVIAKMRLIEQKLGERYNQFVYILPNQSRYFERVVQALDTSIKYMFMSENDVWRFKHLYVPSMVNHDDGVIVPKSLPWIRSRFLKNKQLPQNRKIFIDRAKGSRRLTNKEEIFAILKGWEILDLEQISIQEQINAFQQATDIIATHGAGLVNLVWCRPGTKVIEIVHEHTAKKVYPNLSHLMGLEHKVLTGECVAIPKDTKDKKFKRLNDYNDIKLDSSILLRNL